MARNEEAPALQVIVLGSGGGPLENDTTAFLVRSLSGGFYKASILAVDAGVHLSAIVKILERYLPNFDGASAPNIFTVVDGPFKGLKSPYRSAKAIAAYISGTLIGTYLITHPHLDHISGFVINTANIAGPDRAKRLAGLPSTIEAFKKHIFNNVIWPNLSDEGGVGLVNYTRLIEGGSSAMGEGEAKGYQEICEGLSVKAWVVSHGNCSNNHQHRGAITLNVGPNVGANIGVNAGSNSGPVGATSSLGNSGLLVPEILSPMVKSGSEAHRRVSSLSNQDRPQHDYFSIIQPESPMYEPTCVVDSSVYFIRDIRTGNEIVIFGDVEPDSISLTPRNRHVWTQVAPIFKAGRLGAILIECSYDDSVTNDRLYGHMAPRYFIEELKALAEEVEICRREQEEIDKGGYTSASFSAISRYPHIPLSSSPVSTLSPLSPLSRPPRCSAEEASTPYPSRRDKYPLKGLKIVVIHLKDRLDDGPPIGGIVSAQLQAYEEVEQFGCEFVFPKQGDALYF
ncbi:cAMP phosphodiesterase class-II [Calycina marina]|uniref:cAMP phosphodiesterase class-II n=1 Tax=Calycina marina TaxID=1763456 RepID=A0A9P8CFL6_9HELO|nr:cAMP phosphodiesterase class-II [Calycina marina]